MSNTLSAGKYVICDLCYLFKGEDWAEMCDQFFKKSDNNSVAIGRLSGFEFAMASTAYGDGEYLSTSKITFPVDSGTIGCLNISDESIFEKFPELKERIDAESALFQAALINFEFPFSVSVLNGEISFSDALTIFTDHDEDDDDIDEDDDELNDDDFNS